MPGQTLSAVLHHLIQIDIDAIGAYTRAIDNCGDDELARTLSVFRDDHRRHVRDLSNALREMGGYPPNAADLSGLAIESFTAIASYTGTTGALMAMQSNEVVTNDAYCQALSRDVSGDIRALVERNFADEQRHLDTIRARLEGTVIAGPLLSQATMVQGWMTAFWMNGLWSLSPR